MNENQAKIMNLYILNYIRCRTAWLCRRRKTLIAVAAAIQHRRKYIVKLRHLLAMLNHDNISKTRRIRCCRRFPRNKGWWETVLTEYTDKRFKESFRVSRETFNYILAKIGKDITKQITSEIRISPDMRLAVCLYKLSRGDYNYTLAEMTGIGESTVIKILEEVCQVIVENLWQIRLKNIFRNLKKNLGKNL